MGTIPRKLEEDEIRGFVYVRRIGPLPYVDNDDKEKLIALGELYLEALDKGAFTIESGMPQFIASKTTHHQREIVKAVMSHQIKNMMMLSEGLWRRRCEFLTSLQKSKKEEIVTLTIERLDELLKVT